MAIPIKCVGTLWGDLTLINIIVVVIVTAVDA